MGVLEREHDADRDGDDLRDERTECDAANIPPEYEHEEHVERHVRDVEHELEHEPNVGAAKADEPTEERIVRERGRRRPDANIEVAARERFDLRRSLQQRECDRANWPLQRDEHYADGRRNEERSSETRHDFIVIARTQSLGGEPGRAHPQEAERPEHEREDQRADCDCADVGRVGQPADDRGIHDADQRRRDVREDDGQRDRYDGAMR